MGRPASTRIGSGLAREFSERANAKVFLNGAVTQLGSGFLLRAALVETSTGSELAGFSASAHSADDIIMTVDHLGRDVRDKLGASLREVRSAPALAWAVTPSLEAARLYAGGLALSSAGDQSAGARLFERAVQADTEFAMAYRRMASNYLNMGNPERSAWAAERAFRFRAKLPPALQRLVEGSYYGSAAAFDLDKSNAAFEAGLEMSNPTSAGYNNLATNYRRQRDFERSLDAYRGALKTDSTSIFAPIGIVTVLWATGRKDEARGHVETNLTRWLGIGWRLLVVRADLASAEFRVDSAERILEADLHGKFPMTPNQRSDVYTALAARQRTHGGLTAATEDLSNAVKLNPAADTVGKLAPSVLYRAQVMAWDEEKPALARRLLDSASAAHPPGNASALGYRWTQLAGAYALAGDAAKARGLLSTFEQRATTNFQNADKQRLELARGWIAVAEQRYGDAVAAFKSADVDQCLICALAPLAHAYDLAGQPDSAIAVFERYLSTNYFDRAAQDQMYLAGTYKRLGELYEAKGDQGRAITYYSRFVDLWKHADPELQPKVAQVRQRLAALRAKQSKG
jgi:tetratricopeptide (TPR) repeat protein